MSIPHQLVIRRKKCNFARLVASRKIQVARNETAIDCGRCGSIKSLSPIWNLEFEMNNISEKQANLDNRYMRMARIWAENSYCQRRQVGALLVKDKMIISDGYNGTPSGFENNCENDEGLSKPYVLHAEANAITKVARSSNSSDGATLYVTASPCIECAKLIIQAGIKRVVYGEKYRLVDGIELLERAGIELVFAPDKK